MAAVLHEGQQGQLPAHHLLSCSSQPLAHNQDGQGCWHGWHGTVTLDPTKTLWGSRGLCGADLALEEHVRQGMLSACPTVGATRIWSIRVWSSPGTALPEQGP